MKDHEIRELVNQIRDIAIEYHGTQQLRERIAHVIHAAMLKDGNSPAHSDCCPEQSGVSPAQDQGWIPVNERMPEDEQEVLTRNRMGHCFVSFFDQHSGLFFDRLDAPAECCVEHILVTHWMPLPSAPKEVNHG
jgi:hypothetical protein